MFITYIIYSESINRYYVGSTSQTIDERLRRHNSAHKGFTGRAFDWELKYIENHDSKKDSLILEQKIKKRGAGRFLKDINHA